MYFIFFCGMFVSVWLSWHCELDSVLIFVLEYICKTLQLPFVLLISLPTWQWTELTVLPSLSNIITARMSLIFRPPLTDGLIDIQPYYNTDNCGRMYLDSGISLTFACFPKLIVLLVYVKVAQKWPRVYHKSMHMIIAFYAEVGILIFLLQTWKFTSSPPFCLSSYLTLRINYNSFRVYFSL